MLFEKKLKREETKEFNLKLTRTERDKHCHAQKSGQMCFAVAWRGEGITKAHLKVRKGKRRKWERRSNGRKGALQNSLRLCFGW